MHHMAIVSFRLFRKNLGNLREFFGKCSTAPPPGKKKIRYAYDSKRLYFETGDIPFDCFVMDLSRIFGLQHNKRKTTKQVLFAYHVEIVNGVPSMKQLANKYGKR